MRIGMKRVAAGVAENVARDLQDEHRAHSAGHAANPYDRTDRLLWEHVGSSCKKVGRPALMCGSGESDQLMLPEQIASRLRLDFGVDHAVERADPFAVNGNIPLLNLDHYNLWRRPRLRLRL